MIRSMRVPAVGLAALLLSSALAFAVPKTVDGPGANPECFKPWTADTKHFQWEARPGPYRIAIVNGFVGNTWRIQMIQTAKAYAEQEGRRRPARRHRGLHQSGL